MNPSHRFEPYNSGGNKESLMKNHRPAFWLLVFLTLSSVSQAAILPSGSTQWIPFHQPAPPAITIIGPEMLLRPVQQIASPSQSGELPPQDLLALADQEISNLNLVAARNFASLFRQKHPDDPRGNKLLSFIDFLEGKPPEEMPALTDGKAVSNRPRVDTYSGYFLRESDSGITETTMVLETSLEQKNKFHLSGGILYEGRGYATNSAKANSQVIGARVTYSPSRIHSLSLSVAPEFFENSKTVGRYEMAWQTRFQTWRLGLEAGKDTLRDNILTIRDRLENEEICFSAGKQLAKKIELRQNLQWGKISDGNSSFSLDSKLRFRFLPEWALDLKFMRSVYQRHMDDDGESLSYWAPVSYHSLGLALGWKKHLARHWSCEVETSFTGSTSKETEDGLSDINAGAGILLRTGYHLSTGTIEFSFADRINLNAREKRYHLGGNVRF